MEEIHLTCPQRVEAFFKAPEGKQRYFDLLLEIERMIHTKHWCVSTADRCAPGGQAAVDLFGRIYMSVMSGVRTFAADVSVDVAFRCIARSLANHLATGYENTHRSDHVSEDKFGREVDLLDTSTPYWDPRTEKFTPEQLAQSSARATRFIEFCKKDKNLVAMLMLIRDEGIDRPAKTIAKRIGISEGEVYNTRRRLATALRKFERAQQ
ncbi:MAG TPA: hypothetical protein VGD97_00870 [Lacunisphaera sp.]